ncbi:MAG: DUF192 domain-containing protein [Armatimonadetes bacterium]|nr:DUF192 domain-containing protein [Armatimonadota bacterium]
MRRLAAGVLVFLAAAGLAASAAPSPTPASPPVERGTLHIYQGGRRVTISVEIANTFESRSHGLMFREKLDENAGMLFIFGEDTNGGFWMKNTLIPLSIGFIDRNWRLIEILDMAVAPDPENGPFNIYVPRKPYRYALEVNQGFFKRKGIDVGARLEMVIPK